MGDGTGLAAGHERERRFTRGMVRSAHACREWREGRGPDGGLGSEEQSRGRRKPTMETDDQ